MRKKTLIALTSCLYVYTTRGGERSFQLLHLLCVMMPATTLDLGIRTMKNSPLLTQSCYFLSESRLEDIIGYIRSQELGHS